MDENLRDFIQLLGTTGVGIVGIILTRNRDKNNSEHQLINQLQEDVYEKNKMIETLNSKKELLEDKIQELKDTHEKDVSELKNSIENSKEILNKQIDELNINHDNEMDEIKERLHLLTLENLYYRRNLTEEEIEEAVTFAKSITDITDLSILLDKSKEDNNKK